MKNRHVYCSACGRSGFELCVLSPEKFLRFSSHVLFSNAKILPNRCGLFLSQESNKSVAPKWRNKTSRLHNGHASFFLTCCPLGMPLGRKLKTANALFSTCLVWWVASHVCHACSRPCTWWVHLGFKPAPLCVRQTWMVVGERKKRWFTLWIWHMSSFKATRGLAVIIFQQVENLLKYCWIKQQPRAGSISRQLFFLDEWFGSLSQSAASCIVNIFSFFLTF